MASELAFKDEIAWLENLAPDQWAEIKAVARDLFDAGYFDGNQFKIAIMAFLLWSIEDDRAGVTDMPSTRLQ